MSNFIIMYNLVYQPIPRWSVSATSTQNLSMLTKVPRWVDKNQPRRPIRGGVVGRGVVVVVGLWGPWNLCGADEDPLDIVTGRHEFINPRAG